MIESIIFYYFYYFVHHQRIGRSSKGNLCESIRIKWFGYVITRSDSEYLKAVVE
jgi:hypothetical protein